MALWLAISSVGEAAGMVKDASDLIFFRLVLLLQPERYFPAARRDKPKAWT
jgi:hypothetical protein